MSWLSEFFRRLQILRRRDQFASDLNEEMRLHKQLREEEHGLSQPPKGAPERSPWRKPWDHNAASTKPAKRA